MCNLTCSQIVDSFYWKCEYLSQYVQFSTLTTQTINDSFIIFSSFISSYLIYFHTTYFQPDPQPERYKRIWCYWLETFVSEERKAAVSITNLKHQEDYSVLFFLTSAPMVVEQRFSASHRDVRITSVVPLVISTVDLKR